ncbi:MAG: hypothetical protein Q8O17_04450 [Candidatus Methanoperedens sp.]|nr:hypothetical protein [Candidatus Methanoperedens sp.]
MPKLTFDVDEIESSGEGSVNDSGNIYIKNGRKYIGKRVWWVILKERGLTSA